MKEQSPPVCSENRHELFFILFIYLFFFFCFRTVLYEIINHCSNLSFFFIFTNQYAETTTKSRHYHCPAARALTHLMFTHKECVILRGNLVVTFRDDSENFLNHPHKNKLKEDVAKTIITLPLVEIKCN